MMDTTNSDPYTENMFVTPKEVDEVTDNLANIIANGINIAIQPPIENDDINNNRKRLFLHLGKALHYFCVL